MVLTDPVIPVVAVVPVVFVPVVPVIELPPPFPPQEMSPTAEQIKAKGAKVFGWRKRANFIRVKDTEMFGIFALISRVFHAKPN
jgi:hypothetical protein